MLEFCYLITFLFGFCNPNPIPGREAQSIPMDVKRLTRRAEAEISLVLGLRGVNFQRETCGHVSEISHSHLAIGTVALAGLGGCRDRRQEAG